MRTKIYHKYSLQFWNIQQSGYLKLGRVDDLVLPIHELEPYLFYLTQDALAYLGPLIVENDLSLEVSFAAENLLVLIVDKYVQNETFIVLKLSAQKLMNLKLQASFTATVGV